MVEDILKTRVMVKKAMKLYKGDRVSFQRLSRYILFVHCTTRSTCTTAVPFTLVSLASNG